MTHQNAPRRAQIRLASLCAVCVALAACSPCTLYQRHTADPTDPEPYFLVSICHEGTPQQTTTLFCTSKTRLKTGARNCKP